MNRILLVEKIDAMSGFEHDICMHMDTHTVLSRRTSIAVSLVHHVFE